MSPLAIWLSALPALLASSLLIWVLATWRRNAGLVDIFWSLFFLLAALVYFERSGAPGVRSRLVVALVAVWAIRLAGYLALRNWRAPEDRRYQAIRKRNEPHFALKSLYLVFGLQAVMAWVISAPVASAISSSSDLTLLDFLGTAVTLFGLMFETVADAQLAKFKADAAHQAAVMDQGLWRYTRHPNYFGEFCIAWGLYLIAVAAGGWWTVFSPLAMTALLLKVSGVALLERDIGQRRPAYRDYVARTNAFFPGPRRA
jgi:steroid 5-alpha reductase family enzyme